MHAEETTIGNRARVRHRKPARAAATTDHTPGPIPDDARAQLGKLIRRITAGQHVEHVLELRA